MSLTNGSVAAVVGHYSDDLPSGEDRVLAYSYRFVILPRVDMQLQENLSRNAVMLIRRVRCPDILTHQPRSTWITL